MELEIRKCTASELVGHPYFPFLRHEYTQEAAVFGLPNPQEKLELYVAMEHCGALQIYGAFLRKTTGDELVGFVAVLAPVLPHYGVTVAVAESLFVAAAYRKTGAGLRLIRRAEQHARDVGSPGLLVSAPSKGRLATLLPRLKYRETNQVFFKDVRHG